MPPKKDTVVKAAASKASTKVKPAADPVKSKSSAKVPKTLIDKIYASIRACGGGDGKAVTRSAIKKHLQATYGESNATAINKALINAEGAAVGTLCQNGESFAINETLLSGNGWRVEIYSELVNCQKHPTIFFIETEKEAKAFQKKANDYLVTMKSSWDEVHPSNGGCVWITGLVGLKAGATRTRSECSPVRCNDSTRAFSIFTKNILAWDKECETV